MSHVRVAGPATPSPPQSEVAKTGVSKTGVAKNDAARATPTESLGYLLILTLTTFLALLWSSARVLWQDEFLSFYTDSAATARDVLSIQRHYPISLDPPAYHLLSHAAMAAIGHNAFALRLPALLGFLLLQASLCALLRRLAGTRPAIIAMLFPLLTASFRFAAEGRPYGLLLGLYAAAFTCWYTATDVTIRRWLPLLGLTATIALAITSHYFGVLILIPVTIAELTRTLERRRLDPAVLASLSAGLASLALVLPFRHALAPYRRHYYITGVNLRNISQGYRELFVQYTTWPHLLQRLSALALVLATLALLAATCRRFRSRPAAEPAALWAGLAALAALPLCGYLFGRFVTHTMEVRYVVAAIIAFAVCFALVLERRLRSTLFFAATLTTMLALALISAALNIHAAQRHSDQVLAGLHPPAELATALAADPATPLYTQSLENFFFATHYADPQFRTHFIYLYDATLEVRWLGHDTNAVTALNMQHFTSLHTAPFSTLAQNPSPILLEYNTGWEWLPHELDSEGATEQPLGHAFGGLAFIPQR